MHISSLFLSLSLSLKMGIFEKKSRVVCFTEYNCRSFNISIIKQLTNIKWLAASSLPRSLLMLSILTALWTLNPAYFDLIGQFNYFDIDKRC